MSQRGSMMKWVFSLAAFCLLLTFAVNNTGYVAAQDDVCNQPGYFDGPWDEQKQEDYERCQGQTNNGGDSDDCVIPPSGPWPPCATGGDNGGGNNGGGSADDCVIPPSGPWPPCATGGGDNGGGTNNGGNADDCVIPPSGPWPPCASGDGGNQPAPAPQPQPQPEPVFNEEAVEARIDQAVEILQDYWQSELRQRGVNYRPPGIVQTYRGHPDDPPNAFYIPAMDAIFIDLRLLEEVTADFGMYAAVAVLAHEWGHFIQDQLDLYGQLPGLRQIELQADCMAGSYTTHERNMGLINDRDVQLARDLFFSIGDDQINPDAPYNHPGAHGTGNERLAAFNHGLNTNAQTCIDGFR